MLNKVNICDTEIDNITMEETLSEIETLINNSNYNHIVTPNVDHIIKLQADEELQNIYKTASLSLADGVPLIWAARYLGTPLKEKISGSDLFPKVCELSAKKGFRVFLLGGRPGAADKASAKMRNAYIGLKIIGTYSPPFGFEKNAAENEKIIEMIKNAKPDLLFVGLGAPKQEKWIFKNKNNYKVPVSIGVGVTFEFVAGMVKRAPVWMQKAGLEWFWRVIMEPKRLWKRYLIDDMKIFKLVYQFKKKRRAYE